MIESGESYVILNNRAVRVLEQRPHARGPRLDRHDADRGLLGHLPARERERLVEHPQDALCDLLELADGPRRIAYRDLERARTVFDWEADLAARRAVEQAEKAAAGGKAQRSRRAGREQTAPENRRGDERERVAR